MATSARFRKLNVDYEERVYAGLLGQAIGAGVGRRYLGTTRILPACQLGKVGYDLSERGDFSAHFAHESMTGALTAVRVLDDFDFGSSFSCEHIAQTWLNYAIENRSVLWWDGSGTSAQHTAYLRFKKGAPLDLSGSLEINGVAAEQSGSEPCATAWGMVCPNDVNRAADMAGRAARVSYSGEAVCAAQATAAFVSAAFFSGNAVDDIVCAAEFAVPRGSAVARLIADIRKSKTRGEAWLHTRALILEKYGVSTFGEGHAVPHFAGVVMALLFGEGDLLKSLTLAASAGWGSAANLSVIGCVLGVKDSLIGIDACAVWRAAIDDCLFIPSADAGRCVTDAATEALAISRMGRELQHTSNSVPKKGARYHFELPGSTQGFAARLSSESPGLTMLRNVAEHTRSGKRALALVFAGVHANCNAQIAVAVSPMREKDAEDHAACVTGSPTLYPGQTIRAYVEANVANKEQAGVRPFIRYFGENDELQTLRGPEKWLLPDARHEFQWTLPPATEPLNSGGAESVLLGRPIAEMGLEIFSEKEVEGVIYLDYVTWDGAPRAELGPPVGNGTAWQHAWVNAATHCEFGIGYSALRIDQESGTGLLIQGTRDWRDYAAQARVTPRTARCAGIAIRVQGMQRYYALLLCPENKLRLVKQYYGATVLADADFTWAFGETIELSLAAEGKRLTASANGQEMFSVEDSTQTLDGGAFALVVEEGCVDSSAVRIGPAE